MNIKELQEEIKAAHDECSARIKKAQIKYALDNNPVKVGDIVEDHQSKILVEKIYHTVSMNSGLPSCIYEGVKLKKDGKPNKAGLTASVYQVNLRNPK